MRFIACAVIVLSGALLLAGCSAEKLTPKGEKVRVMESADASLEQCKKFTPFRTKAKSMSREQSDKIRRVLARNSAGDAGANVIVPISEADKDGWQKFDAYQCE